MMDIDNEDKEHKKRWCIGTNQDYEKEYLRLTGVRTKDSILDINLGFFFC